MIGQPKLLRGLKQGDARDGRNHGMTRKNNKQTSQKKCLLKCQTTRMLELLAEPKISSIALKLVRLE